MANTATLQGAIEWVREDLARRHGTPFAKATVSLRSGGSRTFNAVADDGSVVATITNSSGETSGGKKPTGKIRGAITELYFLSLVDAQRRMLVSTNRSFLGFLERELEGALIDGLTLQHVELPDEFAAAVQRVSEVASQEMG